MRFEPGDRIRHSDKPDWGIGEVLRSSVPGRVDSFIIGRGRVGLSVAHARLELVTGEEAVHASLDVLSNAGWERAAYSVYVVRLRDQVMLKRKYAEANPDRNQSLPDRYRSRRAVPTASGGIQGLEVCEGIRHRSGAAAIRGIQREAAEGRR